MTKYVYKTTSYQQQNDLYHFDFPFKLPQIKLPSIKKILDDTKRNVGNAVNNATKAAGDAAKSVGDAVGDTVDNVLGKKGKETDRQWKNHKWIARKRDKNGKWIYDYGNGFPGENKNIGTVYDFDDAKILESRKFDTDDEYADKVHKFTPAQKFINSIALLGQALTSLKPDVAIDSGKKFIDSINNAGKNIASNTKKFFSKKDSKTGWALKSKKTSKQDDLKSTNPNYDEPYGTGKRNCYACTLAYDLRRRGYEVTATEDNDGSGYKNILSLYKNPKPKYVKSDSYVSPTSKNKALTKELEQELAKEPDNSRGYLCLTWSGGGGHAMAYEREGNKTYIYDAQTGNKLELSEYVDNAKDAIYFRTDNIDVNVDKAKEYVS